MNIKIIGGIILAAILALIIIVLVKTFTHPFYRAETSNEVSSLNTFPSENAIKRFAGGIRIATISNEIYEDTNFKPFDEF